jgi:hypothetical protein
MTAARRGTEPHVESITAGTEHIGAVSGDRKGGFKAFDENARLIDVFETREAARRAVYARHKGEARR